MSSTAIIVSFLAILMVSGVLHTVSYNISPLVSLTIGSVYFLGLFGLHCMMISYRSRYRNERWLLLIAGFLAVMICYVSLEFLYQNMY